LIAYVRHPQLAKEGSCFIGTGLTYRENSQPIRVLLVLTQQGFIECKRREEIARLAPVSEHPDPGIFERLEHDLDLIKEQLGKLADPRKMKAGPELDQLIEKTPIVVWLSYSIHGSEYVDAFNWMLLGRTVEEKLASL
jgi:hypothetical protein